jgi:hypothetical protein
MLPEQISAAIEQLEAERERRIEEKIEKGEAVPVPPVVVGAPISVDAAIARRLAELRAAGEGRKIIFGLKPGDPQAIVTGVPRTGRDD